MKHLRHLLVPSRWASGRVVVGVAFLLLAARPLRAQATYLGFDQDQYPGDRNLEALHKNFSFAGYWLNNPPQMNMDPWMGKRSLLRSAGFGFAILFNGRVAAQLESGNPADAGSADGETAVRAARREGFPGHAVIFLDQEEGGRMLAGQLTYLGAWFEAVRSSGFRPGIYLSGIDVPDGRSTISTARDVSEHFPAVVLWVANDQCPPAPGCELKAASPSLSGMARAEVWQFAQSPRRPQFTNRCTATYSADGQCYAPGLPHSARTLLDLDTASTTDPSLGR